MTSPLALDEDHHVHSSFSDDAVSTLAQNVAAARRRGLRVLVLADHVRQNSAWVPDFLAAVDALRPAPGLEIRAGLEAKILDQSGQLDLPDGADAAGRVLIADHQFPGERGPVHPRQVRDAIEAGEVTPDEVISGLVQATAAALRMAARPQLAHLFSILPKMGLAESDVPDQAIAHLARQARLAGARVEVNEKWACPSARTIRVFADAGVPLVASTDSHDCADVGVYASVRQLADSAFGAAQPSG
jgi:putative hydrolase